MKSIARTAVLAVALAAAKGLATSAQAQPSPALINSKISILYAEPKKPTDPKAADYAKQMATYQKHMSLYQRLQARRLLEEFSEFLSPLRLPNALQLRTEECGVVNAFYDPGNRTIKLCYEFLVNLEDGVPKETTAEGLTRREAIAGTFVGVILHEAGHAVFDLLQVPVFGREEDAADQMAAFIALQFNKELARTIVKAFTFHWKARSDPPYDPTRLNPNSPDYACFKDPFCVFVDTHGTASQRMFNVTCIAVGGDPVTFQDLAEAVKLPPQRAANCANEYQQIKEAFELTILPFVDLQKMRLVQNRQWIRPDDGSTRP